VSCPRTGFPRLAPRRQRGILSVLTRSPPTLRHLVAVRQRLEPLFGLSGRVPAPLLLPARSLRNLPQSVHSLRRNPRARPVCRHGRHATKLLTPEWGSVGLDRVSREKFHAFGLGSPCWPRRQLAILVSWVLLEGSLVGFVLWRERRKKINPNLKQTCLDPSIAPCHEGSSDKDDNSGEGTGNRSRGVSSSGNGSVNGIGISGCNSSSGSSEISMSRGVSGSANKAGLSESEYDPLESNDGSPLGLSVTYLVRMDLAGEDAETKTSESASGAAIGRTRPKV